MRAKPGSARRRSARPHGPARPVAPFHPRRGSAVSGGGRAHRRSGAGGAAAPLRLRQLSGAGTAPAAGRPARAHRRHRRGLVEARRPVAVAAHAACPHHRPFEGGGCGDDHARPDPGRARPALAGDFRQALRRRARAGADDRRGLIAALQRRAVGTGDRCRARRLGTCGRGRRRQAAAAARALCVFRRRSARLRAALRRRHRRSAPAQRARLRARRRQLDPAQRSGDPPRAAARLDRRHALPLAAAGDAARRLAGDDRVRARLRRQQSGRLRSAHGRGERARGQDRAADRRQRRAVAALLQDRCPPLHLRPNHPRWQLRCAIGRRAPHPHRNQRGGPARSQGHPARCGGAGRRDPRAGAGADAVGRPSEPAALRDGARS